ncbi:hypothetical protein SAMN05518856_101349 [Paenibacillus sp. OK003]|nr:hypothetical protein SAMN05518856_101349 [Paenibacillus sp. OK003]
MLYLRTQDSSGSFFTCSTSDRVSSRIPFLYLPIGLSVVTCYYVELHFQNGKILNT